MKLYDDTENLSDWLQSQVNLICCTIAALRSEFYRRTTERNLKIYMPEN